VIRRALAVGIAALVLWPGAEHAAPGYPPLDHVVPQTAPGPVPLVVAWERGRCPWPTLVLYDDGAWLRASTLDADCALDLERGRLDDARAADLARRLTAAVQRAPQQTFALPGADWNTVVVAARTDLGYRTVWMEALLPRRPRAFHERAAREPVAPIPGAMLPSLMYPAPLPEPVLHLNDLLTELDLRGAPFTPERRLVRVWPDDLPPGDPEPSPPWPAALPASACRAAWRTANIAWLPASAAARPGHYRLGRLGCRLDPAIPAIPAHETIFDLARRVPPS